MTKVVTISDTHMWGMPLKDLPEGDILVHAGDGTFRGTIPEVTQFHKELIKHKKDSRYKKGYKEIYFIPGNHDFLFEREECLAREIMEDIKVLINEDDVFIDEETGEILHIWGSPVCPPFGPWAFYRGDDERYKLWGEIPKDVDMVVTHGPPKYILDAVPRFNGTLEYTGCPHLANKMLEIEPKVHLFGHIHEGYGEKQKDNTRYVNASIMDGRYQPKNKPIVVDIKGG